MIRFTSLAALAAALAAVPVAAQTAPAPSRAAPTAAQADAFVADAEKEIEAVRASGEASSLEPMSAFERKVVHDAVAAAGLVSESEGAEPRRHVVILPS